MVAAGTVFNEVVIWKPSVTSADHTSPVLNRLTGHEVRIPCTCNCSTTWHIGTLPVKRLFNLSSVFAQGVIFSVAISLRQHLVCTASDDRSVRLWRADDDGGGVAASGRLSLLTDPSLRLRTTLYGHAARVWGVRLLRHCIISVGEVRASSGDIHGST